MNPTHHPAMAPPAHTLDNPPPSQPVDAAPLWQRFAPTLPADRVVFSEILPGGAHWGWRLSRGTALRFAALDARANVSVVIYAAHNPIERYNMPDSLKAQHTAHYRAGHVLMSDMGRALASFTLDTLGWHDPLGAVLDTPTMQAKYGPTAYETHRNAMHRSGRDGLLIETGKFGLTVRDQIAPVNLFSQVVVDGDGRFAFVPRDVTGATVELRMDMDVLLAVSTAPHPLDDRPGWAPGKVGVAAWRMGPAPADDLCRAFRPECARALHNSDVFALS